MDVAAHLCNYGRCSWRVVSIWLQYRRHQRPQKRAYHARAWSFLLLCWSIALCSFFQVVQKWVCESHFDLFRGGQPCPCSDKSTDRGTSDPMNNCSISLYDKCMTDEGMDSLYGWIVGVFAVGGMIGGLMSGVVAQKFGRYVFCIS